MLLLWILLVDAAFWAGISGVIWAAKGGDWALAALMGALFGIFAALYFAFATPKPRIEGLAYVSPIETGPPRGPAPKANLPIVLILAAIGVAQLELPVELPAYWLPLMGAVQLGWAGVCALVWSRKGGNAAFAAVGGVVFGVFAAMHVVVEEP